MRYILILLLFISGAASAQFAPTSAKTAFKWGVSIGTRDSSAYAANDSLVVTINRQGRMMYRSTDGYWKLLANAASSDYVSYVGAITNVNLGNFRLTARSLRTDSIYSNSSAGVYLLTNGGAAVAHWGGGGSVEVDFKGFAGYDANRSASYTARSFTDKNYVDSADGLRVRYTDTAEILSGYKTYYPRTAISAGTGISYNAATGVITNTSPSSGGTVTSVSAGTGMSFTTITSSGAVNADTTVLGTRAFTTGGLVAKANTSLNNVNGVLSSTYGGAGSVSGILKANGSGVVSAAVAGTDYVAGSSLSGTTNYIPKFTSSTAIGNSIMQESSNSIGLASAPNTWRSGWNAFQIARSSYVSDGLRTLIGYNWFLSATQDTYIGTDNAMLYMQISGGHSWLTAPSGTAGNAITFTERMNLSASQLTVNVPISGTSAAFSGATQLATSSGRVLIKTTTDNGTDALQVAGSGLFSSSVTATGFIVSSDRRLKDIVSRSGDMITYKWKDKRDNRLHYGYVAQEVEKDNPDQVHTDDKGMKSVNYIEILVKKVNDLEREIKELKSKIK